MDYDLRLWKRDRLTSFLDQAHTNNLAFFESDSAEAKLLITINQLYLDAIEALPDIAAEETDRDITKRLFLLMAHGLFLAAARTATSGQLSETYVLIRACVERGLYVHYLANTPEAYEAWWRRHDSEAAWKECRKQLQVSRMFDRLKADSKSTYELLTALYHDAIDQGAHPNVIDTFSNVSTWRQGDEAQFGRKYLHYGSPEAREAVAKCGAAGVASLLVFALIFAGPFGAAGISDRLSKLRNEAGGFIEAACSIGRVRMNGREHR
jgi:hypothetical protein